jgi:hypothetical protein
MDAKSRAWQRLQAELHDTQPETTPPAAKPVTLRDPKKQSLLNRLQRLADASLAKQDPELEAA